MAPEAGKPVFGENIEEVLVDKSTTPEPKSDSTAGAGGDEGEFESGPTVADTAPKDRSCGCCNSTAVRHCLCIVGSIAAALLLFGAVMALVRGRCKRT